MSTDDRTDAAVLREVLAAVAGRPALGPVHAAASALLAEFGTAPPGAGPSVVPPGEVPDVNVPHTTRPHIDQPLGDPLPGTPAGHPSPGIIDAELIDAEPTDAELLDAEPTDAELLDAEPTGGGPIGGGLGAGTGGVTPTGYTAGGVPTWDSVRDKVDGRAATASGREELDKGMTTGRTLDDQWNEREAAGRAKLDEIRKSMKERNPGS